MARETSGLDKDRLASTYNEHWGDERFYTYHDDNIERWRDNEPIIDAYANI